MISAFAQNNTVIDSLELDLKAAKEDTVKVNILNSLSRQYFDISDYELAMKNSESALALADKINYKRGKANAYNAIGIIYDDQGNYPEALENYFASLKIREELEDKKGIASCYNNIGVSYKAQSNYPEALEKYLASLKIREEIGDKNGISDSYSNIGIIYEKLGNYPEALKNLLASLKIAEEIGDKMSIAGSYNNIGNVYAEQGNYPKALENYFACLKIAEELGSKYGMATSYNNIGGVYHNQGNYPEALENYFSSLMICEEIGLKYGIAESFNSIGNVYVEQSNYSEALENYFSSLNIYEEIGFKRGIAGTYISLGSINIHLANYKDARKYLDDGLALSKEIGNKLDIQHSYESLSVLDSAEGNFAQSLEHYKMYTIYKDSLLNEESNNQISRMKIQYETEKKDQEIVFLNKDKELREHQLEKQRFVQYGMIAGTVLLLLVGLLLFRSFRLRKKLEKQQAIVQERKRISADLHDDVGSGLSRIILLSEMVKKVAKTPETKKEAQKISTISQELSSNISEIIWALNSNNDYVENLVAYIRRYAAEYFENSTAKLTINTPAKMDHTPISGEHRRNIFYTVKEAMHNIIKHAKATEAELNFTVKNNVLSVVIHDNGIGMPAVEMNRFGNGLINMQNRMKNINGNFHIENHMGTKITLSVPV